MRKIAYIMRGVPGSGKSTRAKELAGEDGVIHSTDDFFYDVDNVYHYDSKLLPEYHSRNFSAFCASLKQGARVVICDNTNVRRWNFEHYVRVAEKAGYKVEVVTIPHPDPKLASERNLHNVPEHAIRDMIRNWEG